MQSRRVEASDASEAGLGGACLVDALAVVVATRTSLTPFGLLSVWRAGCDVVCAAV